MLRLFVAGLFGLLYFVLPGQAAAAPEFSPDVETVLVGLEETPHGEELGTWVEQPGRLSLAEHDQSGISLWLANQGDLVDGFVRWQVTDWRSGARLLLRAHVDASKTYGLSGYVLAVTRDGVELLRVDDGVERPTGFSAKLKGLGNTAKLEVAVWMVGPHGSAQVFDGQKLPVTPLVSLAWTDTRYTSGRVGVLVERRDGKCPITTGLSVRASGAPPAKAPSLDVRVPGPWRFLFLDGGAWQTLDPDVRAGVRVLKDIDPAGRLLVRVDEAMAERLRRAGVVRGRHEVDTPLRLVDDTYMAARAAFDAGSGFYDRDGGIWHDADMIRARLEQWQERDQRVRVVEIGRTHQGRPILAVQIVAREAMAPSVLLLGGVHGCELIGPEIVLDALRALIDDRASDPELHAWADQIEIWAVPDANPDGRAAFIDTSTYRGRKNGRDDDGDGLVGPREGVDLNRNFPFTWGAQGEDASKVEPGHDWYRGPFAASEPEVQAILRLAEREKFVAAVSYHSKGTMLLYPYQSRVGKVGKDDEGAIIAKELAALQPVQSNGRRLAVLREMYPVDGVAEDTLRHAHGTLALLIEAADENPEDPAKRRRLVEDARPSWRALLHRVVEGPRLALRVVDSQRRPLPAVVELVTEHRVDAATWSARCRDGRYDRLLARPGPVRVRIKAGNVQRDVNVFVAEGEAKPTTVVLDAPADDPASWPTVGDENSIDARCGRAAGHCQPDAEPRACWIGGKCVAQDASGPDDTICEPRHDAFAWSWKKPATGLMSNDETGR